MPRPIPAGRAPLELWGGVEPTVNRIADTFGNQLRRSGHWDHPEDLERFAALGLRVLRHPLLWELIAPDGLDRADWSWFDQRLALLQQLRIRPIAGLVHHGSGPRHTSLISEDFAPGLEAFARACAERYPWIEDYTPINEPLTTARFSTLCGLWYPHARDEARFCRALVNQCRATVLAMKQVRAVNPRARLIQPEELGPVRPPPARAASARFEHERGWLTFDLLGGRVKPGHPFWDWLQRGVSRAELEFFLDHPCPPDLLGINWRSPIEVHGGNGHLRCAEGELGRTELGIVGHQALLEQAWERYHLPLALTEVHLDATRQAQLRWLDQAWQGSLAARAGGADVRAVTVWALLGAFDPNALRARPDAHYEPGAFDLRAPAPRPTAIARMARALATEGSFDHPVLERPASRFQARHCRTGAGQPLLIAGAAGTLGQAFARGCELRGLNHRLLSRAELDIAEPASVDRALEQLRPWAILNAAGYPRVGDAEHEPQRCLRENTLGPKVLALAAEQRGLPLVTFSSDRVFDGSNGRPNLESDLVSPETVYGFTKAEAERWVLRSCERGLVVRTAALFGPADAWNFLTRTANRLRLGKPVQVTAHELVSPTYLPDLVRVSLDLLLDEAWGVWHLANLGMVSWADLGRRLAERLSLQPSLVEVEEPEGMGSTPPRCLALASERARLMPALDDALDRYLVEVSAGGRARERSSRAVLGSQEAWLPRWRSSGAADRAGRRERDPQR